MLSGKLESFLRGRSDSLPSSIRVWLLHIL